MFTPYACTRACGRDLVVYSQAQTCTHAHLWHMCACTHMHIFVYACCSNQVSLVPCASLLYAACSPQLGGMVEMLVTLSGVTGSGDCHLPPKHGYRVGSSGAGKLKGGTDISSGFCLVDYQYYFMIIFGLSYGSIYFEAHFVYEA